jgi:O-antigen/teichoic acid export membrane protein
MALRLTSNVVLSRLLTPEIFGIMVVVNSIKYGIELLTDVGIEHNIVNNKRGIDPTFFNTAWTLQMLRGVLLSTLCLCLSVPLSLYFGIDLRVFLLISLAPLINALASTSVFVLVKTLDVRTRNLFESACEVLTVAICVTLAWMTPTVWALVVGSLLSLATRSALSYCISHPPHTFILRGVYVREILSFGKWILISSFVVYVATNVDRIYLGKTASLTVLGVYGLARTISDLPSNLASRLSYQIVFPVVAAVRSGQHAASIRALFAARSKFVLGGAFVMGTACVWADWGVRFVYDGRYHEAGWMLSGLMLGSWFSALASLNEALILGAGRPVYNSLANVVRLVVVAAGLPLGYSALGVTGAIVGVAAGEFGRYMFVAVGQMRLRFSFWTQDATATAVLLLTMGIWLLIRNAGTGIPREAMFVFGGLW